jgi:hypothetical protein
MTDPLDLNDCFDGHEHRIWLDDNAFRYVVVDYVDWLWACYFKWSAKPDKHRRKWYACRTGWDNGVRVSVYLHVEINKLKGPPPAPAFTISDHRDGDEANCRRSNLRWATPSMNRRNINGALAFDLEELCQEPPAGPISPPPALLLPPSPGLVR